MSKAERRQRRQAEQLAYLKGHGYACVSCGAELDDAELWEWIDPREPRTCQGCCAQGAETAREMQAIAHELGVEVVPEWADANGNIVTEYLVPEDPAVEVEWRRRIAHLVRWDD